MLISKAILNEVIGESGPLNTVDSTLYAATQHALWTSLTFSGCLLSKLWILLFMAVHSRRFKRAEKSCQNGLILFSSKDLTQQSVSFRTNLLLIYLWFISRGLNLDSSRNTWHDYSSGVTALAMWQVWESGWLFLTTWLHFSSGCTYHLLENWF